MTCKDCIHYEVCDPYVLPDESFPETDGCKCFKDKSRYIELPFKVGDIAYCIVNTPKGFECAVMYIGEVIYRRGCLWFEGVVSLDNNTSKGTATFNEEYIGNSVFLTKEEAEKALAERKGAKYEFQ